MKQNYTLGEITDEEHQALREGARPCLRCGMLASVDPVLHQSRYKHTPFYRDADGIIWTWIDGEWVNR